MALAWPAHPISLAGPALLLLNDEVLKQLPPGLVTGKLRDIAGMLAGARLRAAVSSSDHRSCGLTGIATGRYPRQTG